LGLAVLVGLAGPRLAAAEESVAEQAGIGAGTALLNVLYIPAKLAYATAGGIIGGFTYGLTLGDSETAERVWEPTLGGDYVLTPQALTGAEPVRFSGGEPAADPEPAGQMHTRADTQWPE
jgi:hypothetical protein